MSPLDGDYPDYNITGDNDEWSYMEIKLCGGYLMIKEISIQKQKLRSYWIRNSCSSIWVYC